MPLYKTYVLNLQQILVICLIVLAIYFVCKQFVKKEKIEMNKRFFVNAAFVFYIVCVIALVFFPLTVFPEGSSKAYTVQSCLQLQPFESISQYLENDQYKQFYGNILLLLPLSIFIKILHSKYSYKKIFIIGFLTSIFIECVQLGIDIFTKVPNKIFDIDDMILNTLGVVLGLLIAPFIKKIYDMV